MLGIIEKSGLPLKRLISIIAGFKPGGYSPKIGVEGSAKHIEESTRRTNFR